MPLRILIVEPDPEDLLFLQDVLVEIEEGRHWESWTSIETLATSSWPEAAALLGRDSVDAILLNPSFQDQQGATVFREARRLAPHVPVILLTTSRDRHLASRLIREGAQDFISTKQVDCGPLAHALRNAIERHRILVATRSAAMTDPLTGVLDGPAFVNFCERDRRLAERLVRRMLLVLAEPRNLPEILAAAGEQRRDLALVEAADFLRSLAGSTGLIGRLAEDRFALAILDTPAETVEVMWSRVHAAASSHRIRMGAAIFEPDQPITLDALFAQAESDLRPERPTTKAAGMRP